MSRPTKNWLKHAEIYRIFGEGDFSDQAAIEVFAYETHGTGDLKLGVFVSGLPNGFVVGKHWADVTVKMWREGFQEGTLFIAELYDSGRYPRWWLDTVLPAPLVAAFRDLELLRTECAA